MQIRLQMDACWPRAGVRAPVCGAGTLSYTISIHYQIQCKRLLAGTATVIIRSDTDARKLWIPFVGAQEKVGGRPWDIMPFSGVVQGTTPYSWSWQGRKREA